MAGDLRVMRVRTRLMAAAGVMAAVAAVARMRRHRQDLIGDTERDVAEPLVVVHSSEDTDKHRADARHRFPRLWRSSPRIMLLALLVVLCVALIDVNPVFWAGILVVALASASYSIRGPRRHYNWSRTVAAIIVFAVCELLIIGLVVIFLLQPAPAPAAILAVTVIGVAGLGVALATGVTWISTWPFAEPLAIGLISATLAGLC